MAIPEKEYLEAFVTAGKHLQACMDASSDSGYRWIKSKPSKPAFADLVFSIGQRMYAVLLVGMTSQKKVAEGSASCTFEIPKEQRTLLLEESERNNLEPVVFPLWLGIMQPLTSGWNLFSLKDMAPLRPEEQRDSKEPVPMSAWELNNFRVAHVMQDLEDMKLPLHTYQDIPGIFPNIWFTNEEGKRSWVAVLPAEDTSPLPEEVRTIHRKLPPEVCGYIARVGVRNAERQGDPPMRDMGMFVTYKGLEKLS